MATRSYTDVMNEIERLNREAQALKQKELSAVVEQIREAVRFYGLTADDLGLNSAASRRSRASKGPSGNRKQPKYRDAAGNTWGGRGPRPLWLRDAIAQGRKLEDFAVGK